MNTMQTNPQDILKTLSLSFEVFPPKKWEDFPGLYETLDELKGLHPEFISCTYGAGGSNSKKTAEIASHIENELGIRSIAHLTCAALQRINFYPQSKISKMPESTVYLLFVGINHLI